MKEPKKNMNACEDFFLSVLKSHVVAATMEVLQMNRLDGNPSAKLIPENTWLESNEHRKSLLYNMTIKIVAKYNTICFHSTKESRDEDKKLLYAKEVFSLGLLYQEYADAIREGDGDRIVRCLRYFLILFKTTQHTNYANEVLYMIYSLHFLLSLREAHQLVWNRTINFHGIPGHNITCDLHLEHMNRLCKDSIRRLGSNKTVNAITRIGKSQGGA